MSRVPGWPAALLALALTTSCRSADPPVRPAEPSPEQEARELVAKARRDVDNEPAATPGQSPRVYVPEGGAGSARPLLVFLHGLGGSGADLEQRLRLRELADALGFAFIAPEGMLDHSGRRFWNATSSCCNFDDLAVDHVASLREWIGAASVHVGVDASRVYIVGFSNGGFMAYRAACEMGGQLAGIFSIAGAAASEAAACSPQKPLSVVQIHGDQDPIVKFEGGHLFADTRRPRQPGAERSLRLWAKLDGCESQAEPLRDLDLDPRIPGAETLVSRFPGCRSASVELWRIRGGNHASGLSLYSIQAIWDFIVADGARRGQKPPEEPRSSQ